LSYVRVRREIVPGVLAAIGRMRIPCYEPQ